MAAITINAETTTTAAVGVNTTIIAARTGRRFGAFQVLSKGVGWVKFSGAAAPDSGFKVFGFQVIQIGLALAGQGNGTDFYEDAVNLFWEGEPDPAINNPDPVTINFIEMT